MAYATLVLDIPTRAIADLRRSLDKTSKNLSMRNWEAEIRGVVSGVRAGHIDAFLGSVRASQTVTCDESSAVNGTDTLTIGGSAGGTLEVEAAPADEDEFLKGSGDTEFADNLVAAINAHSAISKLVYAKRTDTAVVTIYSVVPGPIGNLITLSEAGNGFTLGDTVLASGAGDEVDRYQFGHDPRL